MYVCTATASYLSLNTVLPGKAEVGGDINFCNQNMLSLE